MKIRNLSNPNLIGNNEKSVRHNQRKSDFVNEFDKAASENKRQNLLEITKEIFEQGNKVAERCDISELGKYKSLISEFFNELMDDSYQLSSGNESLFSRKKLYTNIKKINTDVEKIAAELLKTQKNQVEILSCVEDIRGLIMDVFL